MFANLKNGQFAKRSFIYQKKTTLCESLLKILWDEGFIIGYKTSKQNKNYLKIFLKYVNGKPSLNTIQLISRPGRRVYYSLKQIWKIDSNKVFIIFSTTKGLQTITNCKKLKVGGEPLIVIN